MAGAQPQPQQSARPRTTKRAANILSADTSGAGISTATLALPPFNAPPHAAASSSSTAGPSNSISAQPRNEAPQPLPGTTPQYRTSAATAQRKLVAAQRARLTALSKNLSTRLQYASFKVENGWTAQSLSEVENLYYRTVIASRLKGRQLDPATDPAAVPAQGSADGGSVKRRRGANAAGKRKARDSTEAAATNTTASDISPSTSSVTTTSPHYSAGAQPSSVPPSPAWTSAAAGTSAATASMGSHPNPRVHNRTVATGSPPSKRVRYSKSYGVDEGLSGGIGGGAGVGGHQPGKSPASPLKLSNASLGGGKQDLFTAHGLVTPPSFLGTALLSKDPHQQLQGLSQPPYPHQHPRQHPPQHQIQHQPQQQRHQQYRPSIPHAGPTSQPLHPNRTLLPPVQVNGHPQQHFHPTPPLSEQLTSPAPSAGLLPSTTIPSSQPHQQQQRRTPPRDVGASLPTMTTPVLPSSTAARRYQPDQERQLHAITSTPTLPSNSTSRVYASTSGESGGGVMGPPLITNTSAAAAMAAVLAAQSGLGR
ncbi:unnamed protein product [Tilletia laevis]|uniref:Uncharacterized protein n=2 Tax=Tilletia TaxID=13289 RepID=A0A177VB86_9BASI|nr:hypothetical protein CF336_g2543 [Tilletia laevis]KAE8259840.1 hypothetical protein A4X03_0g3975 [Tilletia caries]CAD6969274.1 unnamed protein product [Tilletia controversa]KAE8201196.1 hypothetical protein CF335_g3794 [Tilletia laevis]CAD6886929.1 unnamed protein product [Tilletia caries]